MIDRNSWLSIAGLYSYDQSVLNGLQVPSGIDRQTLIDNLLMECEELEVLYPSVEWMQKAVSAWCRKELPIWSAMVKTLALEYNPIWNKDGKITESRDLQTHGSNATSSGSTATNSRSAYNSSNFENAERDVVSANGSGSADGTEAETITRVEQGNIGVTTTQQMLKEELEIRKTSVYDYIIQSFKRRFCLLVY